MKLMLAFLAVLALLVSPVTAAAAQVACAEPSAVMAMDMPGMDQAADHASPGDPCCDHGAKHPMDQKSCALACATYCAVAAALPSPLPISTMAFTPALLNPARLAPVHPYEPGRLIRPPKSMA